MSLTLQDKQDISGIVNEAIAPLKAEIAKQSVLLEVCDERSNIALGMLSALLTTERTVKQNEIRIDYLESGQKVLEATVKFHEQLLKTRPAS